MQANKAQYYKKTLSRMQKHNHNNKDTAIFFLAILLSSQIIRNSAKLPTIVAEYVKFSSNIIGSMQIVYIPITIVIAKICFLCSSQNRYDIMTTIIRKGKKYHNNYIQEKAYRIILSLFLTCISYKLNEHLVFQ